MKKTEAQELALERSKLIIEYITQILSDKEKVNSTMNFDYAKIDGEKMCTLDIYVPKKNFEKHLNLAITKDHSLVLYEKILNEILETFLEHETIGVSTCYSVKSMQGFFSGLTAENQIGSKIDINFNEISKEFMNLMAAYNSKYNAFVQSLNKSDEVNSEEEQNTRKR